MRISERARRHDVSDLDIDHALRHSLLQYDMGEGFTMLVGPARDGAFLEVGVLDLEGDDPVAIHAMPARPKFYRPLERGR